ncbi:GTPase [Mucidula mucida]|nr:GTPase [Mucidula mucida]
MLLTLSRLGVAPRSVHRIRLHLPAHARLTTSVLERPQRDEDEETEYWRKRKTEWKRKQGGQTFLDHLIVTVRAGKGGNGCAAFHREKFKPFGPPSGGNGGRGGDIYIKPTSALTTLSSVPNRVIGHAGGHGLGTWQNGRNAEPTVIHVPLGTVVRELPREDPRAAPDEWETEEASLQDLDYHAKQDKMRENRWLHYPRFHEANTYRDSFKDAEAALYKQERERRYERRQRQILNPIDLDLDTEEDGRTVDTTNQALGQRRVDSLGHLIATGGEGGLGNPHFLTDVNRSPKFASRGHEGERITLSLELKILADIGLVGMPNAGKSTLLKAVTGGRAKTEVAGYAFTTLNPIVGVVRVSEDGTFEGSTASQSIHDETNAELVAEREKMERGEYAFALTRNQALNQSDDPYGHRFDLFESFRFTIADNPGLISGASDNVGLGHTFLRSMERALALVYVVDLSGPTPWRELGVLRDELEQYQPGMSHKARMVIANKADLLGGDGDPQQVEEAKEKLRQLEEYVRTEMLIPPSGRQLDVVPTSAKYSQNLQKVVSLMQQYVIEQRTKPLD